MAQQTPPEHAPHDAEHDHHHDHEHTEAPTSVAQPLPSAPAGPDNRPFASVIVLAYNSADFLQGCLDNLARTRDVRLEIVCVDNASTDRSHEIAQKHPAVAKAIRSETNLGYSGGNNLGFRESSAPIVVIINPDCYVRFDTISRLIAPLIEDPRVAITGAKLLYPHTNTIQHAGGILHPNAMCEHHGFGEKDSPRWDSNRDVDYVTGALLAIRREDIAALGGFDEEYWPAYYEETDWCWRLRAQGRLIRYVGGAVAWHHESPGLTKNSARFLKTSYRSRMRFLVKNYSVGRFLLGFLPFEAKWFIGPFARGFRRQILRSYVSGLAFALKCLFRASRRGPTVGYR